MSDKERNESCELGMNSNQSEMTSMEEVQSNIDFCTSDENTRPNKRNRGVDRDEMWTLVERKGKRFARAVEEHGPERIPEDRIEVCITCTEQMPKQFRLAKMLKEENIQDVLRVKYLNPFKVIILLNKEESADLLTNCKLFNENGFRTYKTSEVTQTYGVIKDIDIDLEDVDILNSLTSSSPILGIKRLKRRNSSDGKWEFSEAIRVCFKGSSLPSRIKIFDTAVAVDPYVYPVTQCSRCWRYGHVIKFCPSNKIICPKCGKGHENCDRTTYICNNCGGDHMAMARHCPIFMKERKVRELMAEFCCSYKKALTLYVPPSPPPAPAVSDETFPSFTKPSKNSEETTVECDASNVNETPESRPSYAEVVKDTFDKQKKEKNKSKRKKESVEDMSVDNLSDISEKEEEIELQPQDKTESRKKGDFTWKFLWDKLVKKIIERDTTWEDKIMNCLKIVYEGIISFVVQRVSDWPCFKLFNEHG